MTNYHNKSNIRISKLLIKKISTRHKDLKKLNQRLSI